MFNGINQTKTLKIAASVKQRFSLLLLLLSWTVLTSPNAFTKQEDLFTETANIYSIAQDEKDFIWISGQNGLFRYDGKQVLNFSNKEKGWSIPFNWIHSISKLDNQLILTTETKGIWLFDTETGETQPININAETNTFYKAIHHKNSYYAISMAPQNLYRYDIETAQTLIIAKNINNNFLFSSENRVYFNDGDKWLYLDSKLNNNQIKQIDAINERIIASTIIKSTAIIASENHLFSIEDNGQIVKKPISSPIIAITPHNSQNTILSVNLLGEIHKREMTTLKQLDSNFSPVEKSRYQVIHHDNSGVLWLGDNRGLQQFTEAKVKNYPIVFDTNFSLLETEVFQGELYIGSYGLGMYTFSPFTAKHTLPVESTNQSLSSEAKKITDLLTVDQSMFIATFDGLWRYNKTNKQTNKIDLSFKGSNFNELILLKLNHNNGLLYIASDGQGLIIYDLNIEKVVQHINKNAGLSSGEVIDILPLSNGDIWLATANGIDIFNEHTRKVKNITNQTGAMFVSLLQVDGKIFVATKGNGIQVYNQQGELLALFAKGINFSYMSLIDDHIFASAKPGLYKINPNNYQSAMVANTDGFSFTDNAFIFDNSLHVANSTGILQLNRNSPQAFHSKVYISKTTVSGKSYLLNKAIKINSGNDVITLDLASLDYRPGVEKLYRYTLDGNKWHQINGNQLTLTGLASGDYHIEIMATNSLGQWSEYKAYTDISVAFPWYWTPQIRLVYAVSLICLFLLGAWLIFLRSKSISHIHSLLQNDINNYGKTSTQVKRSLTAALSLISQNELDKGKLLLQQCIDNLNEQQQSPEPNSLNGSTLTEAVPFLIEYLYNKYQVRLYYQLDIDENELDYELRADLYRVIFEAVTSSILSGNGRNFKVILQKFKSKIWLNISNDSQSFVHFNSKVSFDISMYYIRQIAKKHKGSVNTFEKQDKGSQLVLGLPVVHEKQIHLKQVSASSNS